ncbi:hypothetical protein [Desulfopila inferna]|uniref:hypothetical protein n=1 Tax=Desulfopila inferna TaxID=468528 RepID=UPI00196500B2|nr:hypothetical protein [Desulfopila inferna]MBM9604218.1 hypothetical protein [Desulfopila inferna]
MKSLFSNSGLLIHQNIFGERFKGDMSTVVVTEKDMRPNNEKDSCPFCKQRIGEYHKDFCDLARKTAQIIFAIRAEISLPDFIDEYCMDNKVREISNDINNLAYNHLLDNEGENLLDFESAGATVGIIDSQVDPKKIF